MIVKCNSCGADTSKQPRDIKRNKTGNFYCSRECANKGYSNKYRKIETVKCENCSSNFEIRAKYKREETKFCSQKCNAQYKSKKSNIVVGCTLCGIKIEKIKSLSKGNNFCSMRCKNKFHRMAMKGSGNPRYVDGRNTKPYHEGWNTGFKEHIRELHGRKCILCSIEEEKLKFKLDIHHIDFDKQNPKLENLAPLCKKCHLGKAHKGGMSCKKELSKQLEKLVAKSLTHTT